MDTDELIEAISENHRLIILAGAVICFISTFLPFWSVNALFITVSPSLSATWMFWVYLLLIIGIFIGYFLEFGEQYPFLFLVIGIVLFLMTIVSTQIGAGSEASAFISLSIGFFLELIGSIAVSIGGYYYYIENN